jgi:hypothetical protein
MRILFLRLPHGVGEHKSEWDGSIEEAELIVDAVAANAAENVVLDQEKWGPTGWEPEFDDRE